MGRRSQRQTPLWFMSLSVNSSSRVVMRKRSGQFREKEREIFSVTLQYSRCWCMFEHISSVNQALILSGNKSHKQTESLHV